MGGYYYPRRGPTIADLLMERGRIEAEGAARSGDIWANTVAGVGQQLAGGIQRYGEERDAAHASNYVNRALTDPASFSINKVPSHLRARVMEGIKTAAPGHAAMRQVADQQAVDKAVDAGSVGGFNADAIEAGLPGHLRMGFRKSVNEANEKALQFKTAQANYFGSLALSIEPFLKDKDGGIGAATLAIQHAKENGAQGTDQILAQLQQDPSRLPQMVQSLIQNSPEARKEWAARSKPMEVSPGSSLIDPQTGNVVASVPDRPPNLQHVETDKGIQTFDPRTGTVGPVIAQGKPREPRQVAFQSERVLNDEGQPVLARFDPRSGQYTDPSGKTIKNPRPVPQQQRLTKEERQDFSSWNYSLPKLDAFTKYVEANPGQWGKWDAFKQSLKQALPGLADAEYADQRAFISRINSEIRHALYGASLTGGEQQSAEGFIVSEKDQPEVILAKVREAASRARSNMDYYRKLGFDLPQTPQAPAAPAAPAADPNAGWTDLGGGVRIREKR